MGFKTGDGFESTSDIGLGCMGITAFYGPPMSQADATALLTAACVIRLSIVYFWNDHDQRMHEQCSACQADATALLTAACVLGLSSTSGMTMTAACMNSAALAMHP